MLWSLSASTNATNSLHAHDLFEFICCQGGSGTLHFAGQQIDFRRGRTILIAPGVAHHYAFEPGEEADLKLICMNGEDVATYLSPAHAAFLAGTSDAGVTFADHADHADPADDAGGLQALLALIPDGFGLSDVRQLRVVWGAINLLLALHGKAHEIPADPALHRYRDRIDEVCRWLDAHLAEALKIDEVASRFGFSRSLLTREFRRHTGKSLVDYCNTRRVETAAIRLASSHDSITGVALASGFANLSHFHRQFKDNYGLTPAAFRRKISGIAEHD
ncbi:AraC family transcriptional regulator [Rhodocyclus tenuis]|uniref:AraC family transcriptional regulator n=1 Tax=Rhodocyclus tenuis TaxID=1066 RepID=UPI001905EB74|nr:AraC family transcriptional regulator [Rhodocyclus tenuis]MBK1681263.1 hypothetical protein [Rhodocyclus tenuis]